MHRLLLRLMPAVLALSLLAKGARAADWSVIAGTEDGRPELAVLPFGVVQVAMDGNLGGAVTGLREPRLLPFEGRRPASNVIEGGDAPWGFAVRRARPGLRGTIPGTSQRVGYSLLAELGTASIARSGPVIADASLTLSLLPGVRVRVGQMKLPTMDEGAESNAQVAEWITPSLAASQLVLENRVKGGAYLGGSSGFRDVGVKLFDSLQRGHAALAWEVMLGNGRPNALEAEAPKDVAARTTFSWVFRGARGRPWDPHREELSFFVWAQRGERDLDGTRALRLRSGTGVHLELSPVRIRAELVRASGALLVGASPPFPGEPLVVDPHGEAVAAYVQARVRVLSRVLVGLRYEELHKSLESDQKLRVTRALSPMVEVDLGRQTRLQATYDARWVSAPHGSEDAKTIAEATGDRVAVQATAFF